MTNPIDPGAVLAHYTPGGLVDRLRTALAPADRTLQPAELAPLDQFHVRGLAATADLARLAGITSGQEVLDLGSGIGGPARYLAAACGCHVTGLDLSEEFTDAARYLAGRAGLQDQVTFLAGDATRTGLPAASFDVVLLQHVAMNIAERAALYGEVRRLLRAGGRLATYDIVRRNGEPIYPVPWARTPQTSFLLDAAATVATVNAAGLRTVACHDDTEPARAFFAQASAGPPAGLSLGVVMGPGFRELAGNLARSILEERVGVLMAVFERQ
jgi:SAM-dependent methyltransferase